MAPATLIRSVQRRMPGVSYATLIEFSDVVYSIADEYNYNTLGGYQEFIKRMDRAVKNKEQWACEAAPYSHTPRARKR
ncbi:hypothetical protein [Streptomyces sp. 5-10]|uniref:hypothetical protein n=1 Tax=Streptomyces sp. 5-10 TaxID=878925 RepID=UPI00168ABC2C|nr:hypothetical protein [Streptomyces sp. 5-10]MBD3004729.1 hypothetical protein [Streptomyces sp. 5-10]